MYLTCRCLGNMWEDQISCHMCCGRHNDPCSSEAAELTPFLLCWFTTPSFKGKIPSYHQSVILKVNGSTRVYCHLALMILSEYLEISQKDITPMDIFTDVGMTSEIIIGSIENILA